MLPLITVGLPVYNGEVYVGTAIESVLAQTMGDFELVICDNASTDGTETICRDFAARDSRIRYFRNEHNLGAGPNYNLTFERASSPSYFKWLAHDDVLLPDYLEECVTRLEAAPDAVLCQSVISNIDEEGEEIDHYDSGLTVCRTSDSPARRFGECILKSHRNTDLFGVVRREKMKGSVLHGDYYLQDRAFVAEMSLRGRFEFVDRALLGYRRHPRQFSRALRVFDTFAWHNTSNSRWNYASKLMLYSNYLKMTHRNVASWRELITCYRYLIQWWATGQNAREAVLGAVAFVSPSGYQALRSFIDRHKDTSAQPLPR